MKKEIIGKTAYSQAYSSWFSAYETERRRQRKRAGSRLLNFPDPPPSPEAIAELVDLVGVRRTLSAVGVHRSTLARWLSGQCVMPVSAWRLLFAVAHGRLPDMSEDWSMFRFDGDRLVLIGTRIGYTAREIAGWQYQVAHAEALNRRIHSLEQEKAYLLKVGIFDAANDALASQ